MKRDVDAVNAKRFPNKFKKELYTNSMENPKKLPSRPLSTHCERWGKNSSHARLKCLTKDTTYHKCNKKGHWASVCKSWTVGETEEDYTFLGENGTETGENFWSAELFVNNNPIHFKIDTRAVVTVIPESIYGNIVPAPDLLTTSSYQDFVWPGSHCSPCPGLFYRNYH